MYRLFIKHPRELEFTCILVQLSKILNEALKTSNIIALEIMEKQPYDNWQVLMYIILSIY